MSKHSSMERGGGGGAAATTKQNNHATTTGPCSSLSLIAVDDHTPAGTTTCTTENPEKPSKARSSSRSRSSCCDHHHEATTAADRRCTVCARYPFRGRSIMYSVMGAGFGGAGVDPFGPNGGCAANGNAGAGGAPAPCGGAGAGTWDFDGGMYEIIYRLSHQPTMQDARPMDKETANKIADRVHRQVKRMRRDLTARGLVTPMFERFSIGSGRSKRITTTTTTTTAATTKYNNGTTAPSSSPAQQQPSSKSLVSSSLSSHCRSTAGANNPNTGDTDTDTCGTARPRMMATFRPDEIMVGRLLGTGGFSVVFEIEGFEPNPELQSEMHSCETAARYFLAEHARRKVVDDNDNNNNNDDDSDNKGDNNNDDDDNNFTADNDECDHHEANNKVVDEPAVTKTTAADEGSLAKATKKKGSSHRRLLNAQSKKGNTNNESFKKKKQKQQKDDKKKKKKKKPEKTVARYALKHLRHHLAHDEEKFFKAAVDLALEAQLLLALDHQHIVSIRGWSRNGCGALRSGRHTDFFLIMDRLPETLEDRLWKWRQSLKKYKSRSSKFTPWCRQKYAAKMRAQLVERLKAGCDIAGALEYLHDRRICQRDVKIANVGFDIRGELKIFDFGLSRLLPSEEHRRPEGYLMSRVGTKYYMAPEVRFKKPYDLSADVYSFGITLWEILSLSTPREYYKQHMHKLPKNTGQHQQQQQLKAHQQQHEQRQQSPTRPQQQKQQTTTSPNKGKKGAVSKRSDNNNNAGRGGGGGGCDAGAGAATASCQASLSSCPQYRIALPPCCCWPHAIRDTVQRCIIADDPTARPTMAEVRLILRQQIEDLGGAEHGQLFAKRRRSTFRLDVSQLDFVSNSLRGAADHRGAGHHHHRHHSHMDSKTSNTSSIGLEVSSCS